MTASTQNTPNVVASCTDIGPREVQQDRVIAHVHSDGSWVIAVFDGLGGHVRGDEAAQAAADAFPTRIDGSAEMSAAIKTANAAVWNLLPEDSHVPAQNGAHAQLARSLRTAHDSSGGCLDATSRIANSMDGRQRVVLRAAPCGSAGSA